MPRVEVSLPDQTESEIDRLVDQGEFINRDQAIEELLTMGISAYQPAEETDPEEENLFERTRTDQEDPARWDDPDDGRTL